MTVTNQNISIFRGDAAVAVVGLTKADGTPYDATVPGNEMQWRMATSSNLTSETLALKTLGDGLTGQVDGVAIAIDPADSNQPAGLYYHELKVRTGDDIATVMTGTVIIRNAQPMAIAVTPAAAPISLAGKVPTLS